MNILALSNFPVILSFIDLMITTGRILGTGQHHPAKFAQQFKKINEQRFKDVQYKKSPTTAAAMDLLQREPTQILAHLAGLLTKNGKRQDAVLMRVHNALSLKYGHPNPVEVAVDAVRPIVRYFKPKNIKIFVPEALWPRTSIGMALRWIVKGAEARTYGPWKVPDLERGLGDELDSVLDGTSALYARKLQCHRNPN
jgi:ribosomal protein S7